MLVSRKPSNGISPKEEKPNLRIRMIDEEELIGARGGSRFPDETFVARRCVGVSSGEDDTLKQTRENEKTPAKPFAICKNTNEGHTDRSECKECMQKGKLAYKINA